MRHRKQHTGGLFKAILSKPKKKSKSQSDGFGSLAFNYYGKNTL